MYQFGVSWTGWFWCKLSPALKELCSFFIVRRMWVTRAIAILCGCVDWSEPWLLANATVTKLLCAGSFKVSIGTNSFVCSGIRTRDFETYRVICVKSSFRLPCGHLRRERADLLALVCDVYCDFVTFPFGILGQVWYLIVSIPDPCCLSYFVYTSTLCPIEKKAWFVFLPNASFFSRHCVRAQQMLWRDCAYALSRLSIHY